MLRRELDGGLHGYLEDFLTALCAATDSLTPEQRAQWDACVRHEPGSVDLMLRLDFVDEREELIAQIQRENQLNASGAAYLQELSDKIQAVKNLPRILPAISENQP